MGAKRLPMRKLREILRLKHDGESEREAAGKKLGGVLRDKQDVYNQLFIEVPISLLAICQKRIYPTNRGRVSCSLDTLSSRE